MGLGGQLSGERRLSGAADGLIPAAPAGAIHYISVVLRHSRVSYQQHRQKSECCLYDSVIPLVLVKFKLVAVIVIAHLFNDRLCPSILSVACVCIIHQ